MLLGCLDQLGAAERGDEVVGPLWEAWAKWLELDAVAGLVEPWPAGEPFRLAEALAADPIPGGRLTTNVGAEAQSAAELQVRAGSSYRGDIISDLAQLKAQAGDPNALQEVRLVERWYSRGRYRAIAWQHHAACVQAAAPWGDRVTVLEAIIQEAFGRPGSDRAEIPPDVVTTLGDMRTDQYAELLRSHRRDLHAWWHHGDRTAVHRTADALAALTPTTPARTNRVGVSEIIGAIGPVGGAVTGAALGGPPGAAVGGAIGMVAKLSAGAMKTPTHQDRVRDRIVEAWMYRTGR